MRINELSKKYNVDKRTIDYYSNVAKILPFKQNKGSNNYRDYDANSEKALRRILILRELDFSIDIIKKKLDDPYEFSSDMMDHFIEELKKKREKELSRINSLIDYAEEEKRENAISKEEKKELINKINDEIDKIKSLLMEQHEHIGLTEGELFIDLKGALQKYSIDNNLSWEAAASLLFSQGDHYAPYKSLYLL